MDTYGKIENRASGRKNGSPWKKSVSRSVKVDLQFLGGRIGRYLKKGRYALHVGGVAIVYLMTVLEYLVVEVLAMAETAARTNMKNSITLRQVVLVVRKDEELGKLLAGVTIFLSKESEKVSQNSKSPSKATKSPQKA